MNQQFAALRPYLTPDSAAQLDNTDDLPAATRATLAQTLQGQLEAHAVYIPARLVRSQLAQPQPGRTSGAFWEGSILFADLSGFTALSEALSKHGKRGSEEVSAIINRLFAALVAEVNLHGGMLLKFGGDALTAFFDAATLGEIHAVTASSAALAMQARMQAFAVLDVAEQRFQLALRVGVHSGRVFAAEVGSPEHIELVVTGSEVNRVAFAQEIATPGDVVISAQTAALLDEARTSPHHVDFRCLHQIRAVTLPHVGSVVPPCEPAPSLAKLDSLAVQVAALKPYLVHNLPQRFLAPTEAEAAAGEFRPVSVLFANFHDFSALLDRIGDNPTLAAAILNAYFQRVQNVVHRYDGIINKVDMYTHGDKLMALFGAPTAHEDDPLRAVRCALDLQAALGAVNAEIASLLADAGHIPDVIANERFHHHIGINTGNVFAGRVGGIDRYEYTVMGSTVNLAARLMAAAADGEVLLSPSTYRVTADYVSSDVGAPLQLKGLAESVVPHRARGAADVARISATETTGRLHPAPLIGRDAEIAVAQHAAVAALRGAGRVLAITGDAGTGKSRLAQELMQRLVQASITQAAAAPPVFRLCTGDCQSYNQRTPYAAIRTLLGDTIGFDVRRTDAADWPKLVQNRVRQYAPTMERFATLLGDIFNIDLPDTDLTSALSPQQRHDRVQDLVVALFAGAAAHEPHLILLEDAQWIDSSSLEVLERLARLLGDLSLALALTYRADPPIAAAWDDNATTLKLVLRELSAASSTAMLAALLGSPPPPALLPLIDRAQGNPFFVEELARSLVQSGVLEQDAQQAWHLTQLIDEITIPNSIEGLLISRLDRLDDTRHEVLQIASVVGNRFESPIVAGVCQQPTLLEASLAQLTEGELINVEQPRSRQAYRFRHMLLREVAYEGILYARRRELHYQVAQRIEHLSHDQLDEYLALLAWHYQRAEAWPAAFEYHVQAGTRAQQRFANGDALAFFKTALDIVPQLSALVDHTQLMTQVAELHERVGDIRLLLGEYDEAETRYRQAKELLDVDAAANAQVRLRLYRLLATVDERRSAYDAAFVWLHQGMANATSAVEDELAGCYLLGAGIYYRQGDYTHALEWARQGLAIAERLGNASDTAHALLLIGTVQRDQGEFSAGIQSFQQAQLLFKSLNDVTRLSDTLNNLGILYLQMGRWRDTVRSYEDSLRMSENIGDIQATARTSNNLAVVLVGRGELERAGELYRYSSNQFEQIGSVLGVAITRHNRGEVLLLQGHPAEALALFDESIATLEHIQARNILPEVLRLAAEAQLLLGDTQIALQLAEQSYMTADELGMAVEKAVAQRVLGQIALREQHFTQASVHFTQSLQALEKLEQRYEVGKVYLCWAHLALAQADPTTQHYLAQAKAIFNNLDAQHNLAQVRELEQRTQSSNSQTSDQGRQH